ncbi:hypothetical protein SAMN06269185_0640 [Natronoarchaeum philippinense]|uniref:DUF7344 domain-containing protein n=1 Tax=Natronoarchaeum philippinense TaxID=558529 RepID=A0A285N6X2_NATPI|nr:permease [Natronoarchaeum philippinense]SNZ04673.1 hypothetical protein SAMN06269185_0640 [Natronoarchaeum philippinense]
MQSGLNGGDDQTHSPELTPGRVFEVLESSRRRHVLSILRQRSCELSNAELAATVAVREGDYDCPTDVDEDRLRQVQLSLHHVHLPKLESVGLIERSRGDAQTVALAGDLGPLEPGLDARQTGEQREYYTN